MFALHDHPARLCDGISRRELLRVGGLSALGLSHRPVPPRRPAAARNLGPKARRPSRDPRRIQADRHQRARHSDR
jgi:hypothetical protein